MIGFVPFFNFCGPATERFGAEGHRPVRLSVTLVLQFLGPKHVFGTVYFIFSSLNPSLLVIITPSADEAIQIVVDSNAHPNPITNTNRFSASNCNEAAP